MLARLIYDGHVPASNPGRGSILSSREDRFGPRPGFEPGTCQDPSNRVCAGTWWAGLWNALCFVRRCRSPRGMSASGLCNDRACSTAYNDRMSETDKSIQCYPQTTLGIPLVKITCPYIKCLKPVDDSGVTHDSKKLSRILIPFDSWLKKLSGILIRIKSWLNDSNQLLISLTFLDFHSISFTFLGILINFVYLFGDFTKFRLPFVGHSSSDLTRISSWLKQ